MSSLDYDEYSARAPHQPGHESLKKRLYQSAKKAGGAAFDTLLLPYALQKHAELLRTVPRVDNHTYTCFLRAPSQLDLLSGPILEHLNVGKRLDVTLLACSNGAEAYTIASWLKRSRPDLDFHIHASDLHPEMVERASSASYSRDEALASMYITEDFVRSTFDQDGDQYVVKPEIRAHVSFTIANLLDGKSLEQKFGKSSLVVAQNVLFHLQPGDASKAFANLVNLLDQPGVLMVEGMDLDLREKLTSQYSLSPFTDNVRKIYSETRAHTPRTWWNYYWGTEPFVSFRRNPDRRYATAFKRDAAN